MKREEIQKGLKAIRDNAYSNQPVAFDALIDLLDCAFCEHRFELKNLVGDPQSPPEIVMVCKHCGYEQSE